MAPKNRFTVVSLMALSMAMPALAQQTPPAEPAAKADRNSNDVVVVTASKREETVQDIAVAVTAISSELRDEIGLSTVQDYTNFAPGLSYSTSNDRLGMRGVTRTSNNFGIRSGISNYVDGVYFSSAIPASRETIFVDRVEVVRGPQGTLYGRDSIGGALNVISKRPSNEFEGEVHIGFANFDERKIEARISGPITDDIRFSLAGNRFFRGEGFLTNVAGLENEANRRDDTYIEGQLEGDIGDRFSWWARLGSLSWHRVGAPGGRTGAGDSAPYDTRLFPGGSANINSFFGFSGVASGLTQAGTQTTNPNIGANQQLKFNADFTQFTDLFPTTEGALEAVYSFDNFDLKYLGGYVWYHYNLQIDNDGGPVSAFKLPFALGGVPAGNNISVGRITDYNENRAWFSNEINLISTGSGPFQWVTGIYQYQENYTQPIYVSSHPGIGGTVLRFPTYTPTVDLPDFTGRNASSGSPQGGDLWYFSNNQGLNHAYGAFFQGDYQINDAWKITGGIRWSKDVMNGADQVRYISHYALGAPRVDGTSAFFGGPDPTTVTASNPCGFAGLGIVNTNVTAANSAAGCGGLDKSRYGIYLDPVTGIARRQLAASWNEVTGVLGVDWTPDTDTLVYAKYNRGYKPGGLGCADTNCNLTATPYTDKELVDAFELGLKREWPAANLTTNAVAFYYDYQGYQVSNTIVPDINASGVRPPTYVSYINLPSTVTTGFELETIWRPTDALRILFNYGYANPEIGDTPALVHALDPFGRDPAANVISRTNGPCGSSATACIAGQNLNGNMLPFNPKNKAALVGTYTVDMEDGAELNFTASSSWQDVAYSSVFNRWATKIPSWVQTDARVTWTNADQNITLIGFVRNLFDDVIFDGRGGGRRIGNTRDVPLQMCGSSAATSVSHAVNPTGVLAQDCLTISETYRPPRTYGVELQYKF
jgi:iron complex outermembrane receptor protein